MEKIQTVEQLKAEYPELVKEIEAKIKADLDMSFVDSQKAKNDEKARILGLASIQFGDENGKKFSAVVESGVSVEQFKAIQDVTGAQSANRKSGEEKKQIDGAKKETLEAIKKAGADNPGSDAGGGEKLNFMQEVDKYQRENKCSRFVAMQEVNRRNPELRQEFLKTVNS